MTVTLLSAYPVGSIYMSVNSTNPGTLFGGTWARITGRFLLAATDNGANGGNSNASIKPGYTGGEATHALTPGETAVKNHSHTMAHTHTIPYRTNTNIGSGSSGQWTTDPGTVTAYGGATGGSSAANTGGQKEANGSAHNNMPPYLAVYVWKRTA